jgi:hypothetical protein
LSAGFARDWPVTDDPHARYLWLAALDAVDKAASFAMFGVGMTAVDVGAFEGLPATEDDAYDTEAPDFVRGARPTVRTWLEAMATHQGHALDSDDPQEWLMTNPMPRP